ARELLLTAHTNKYFSSPGANDNASGVSVLLKIAENLMKRANTPKLNVRIVFFDHEDGLACIDGSTFYVNNADRTAIDFVLNIDMVGAGNTVVTSPKNIGTSLHPYMDFLVGYFAQKHIKYFSYDLPPLMVEDHMPFTKYHIPAVSLNLMPEKDFAYLRNLVDAPKSTQLVEYLRMRSNKKKYPMEVMRHRHNDLDTSQYIEEESLALCEDIVMKLIAKIS
ncbi:MAG: M28 family peptidase, partial [bacterium]|nr:M28 family peptidase [bacterium]